MTAETRDRIRAQVLAARKAQGLGPTVNEPRFLTDLAAEVLAQEITEEIAA
jgi:hypothetical protein